MYRQFKYMIKTDADEETFNRAVEMARRGEFDHNGRRDDQGVITLFDHKSNLITDPDPVYVYTRVTIMSVDCESVSIVTKPTEHANSTREFPRPDRTGLGVWQHMFIMMPDGTELCTSAETDDDETYKQLAEYLNGGDLPKWAKPGTETATVEPEDIVF